MDDNLQTSVAVTKGAGVLDGRVALRVALAGQPNVGKSTVFNLLTGLSQHVGNWPGKTVEQKTGIHHHGDITLHVVDLPGTYSLTANSLEEVIARDYIVRERPDVVVTVVNAASLERHLYLVAELLPLANRLVVALNMVDVAASEGMQVEARVLEAALGVPVVSMSASKNQGVSELVETVVALVRGELPYTPCIPEIREDHRQVLDEVLALLDGCIPDLYPPDWVALKLLEGDTEITALLREQILPADRWAAIHEILMAHEDAVLSVASGRYEWVGRMVRAAVTRPRAGQITLTERLDRWATHPIWGLGILAAILGLVFGLTFAVKLMERGEQSAQTLYKAVAREVPQALRIAEEEDEHEHALLGMLDEERLRYIGSMVLGLSDALVELTGTLAGLTLALQNTRLIATAGLITGISASLSMAASEFLSTQSQEDDLDPKKASLYTGAAYVVTVVLLILPYFLLQSYLAALGVALAVAMVVVLAFTYYVSVARDMPFRRRFLQMAGISLGVAALSFAIGYVVREVLGIEI